MSLFTSLKHRLALVRSWRSFIGRKPETDWKILLGMLIVATVVFLGFAVQLYVASSSEMAVDRPNSDVTLRPFNAMNLDTVLNVFSEKKKKFEAYRAIPPRIVDPSR